MKKNRRLLMVMIFSLFCCLFVFSSLTWAAGNARMPAIKAGADRLIDLQRVDPGWEGTWYWYVGSTYNATNLDVVALGQVKAYLVSNEEAYLDSALQTASFAMTHLGVGATGTRYSPRMTAPDIILLYLLYDITCNPDYAERATLEWNNIRNTRFPTAAAMVTYFRQINRPSIWDIASYMEAASLSGDYTWAADAAAILADLEDSFFYNPDTWWLGLNVSGAIRALVSCSYGEQYNAEVTTLVKELIAMSSKEDGVGGSTQDTAYAVIAFSTVGGQANQYANELAKWLVRQQSPDGGWIESDGYEYPETEGEAVWAIASTIGHDQPGTKVSFKPSSQWRRNSLEKAVPFTD